MSSGRWRGNNEYNETDEWECFVRAHSALLGCNQMYMPGSNPWNGWFCNRCTQPLAVACGPDEHVAVDRYYYWCRCGNHGYAHPDSWKHHKREQACPPQHD